MWAAWDSYSMYGDPPRRASCITSHHRSGHGSRKWAGRKRIRLRQSSKGLGLACREVPLRVGRLRRRFIKRVATAIDSNAATSRIFARAPPPPPTPPAPSDAGPQADINTDQGGA